MSKKSKIWYGYLEAGSKSSPVLMDPKLDTGNTDTMYLYNLKRDQILEYQRELIQPKLRELNGKDSISMEELKKAFNKAVKDFFPRNNSIKAIAETPMASPPKKIQEPEIDLDNIDDTNVDLEDDIDLVADN